MDSDFKTGGVMPKSLEPLVKWFKEFVNDNALAVMVLIVILIILVVAFFFGWFGAATKREGLRSCMPGNQSAMCRQGRDGPGEGLTNSSLAVGYGADPAAFCTGAGEPTDDPRDYLLSSVSAAPSAAETAGDEYLTSFASPTDRMDQNLMIAMQH